MRLRRGHIAGQVAARLADIPPRREVAKVDTGTCKVTATKRLTRKYRATYQTVGHFASFPLRFTRIKFTAKHNQNKLFVIAYGRSVGQPDTLSEVAFSNASRRQDSPLYQL